MTQPAHPAPHTAHSPHNGAGPFQAALARANQRVGFATLIRVEFRKLVGTISDKILLLCGPLFLVGMNLLILLGLETPMYTAGQQVSTAIYAVRVGQVVLHAALIKLITGEWQHRSAQPTLLVQPSRGRYFLAQATVVGVIWLLATAIQITMTFVFVPIRAWNAGSGYLLDYRVGWVVGIIVLSSLMAVLIALTMAMLLPNAAGALAAYFVSVPALFIFSAAAPNVAAWLDPMTPATALAGTVAVQGPGPVIVSLLLWIGLLGLACYRVARRDVT